MFDIAPMLDCAGRKLRLDRPQVMGIVNVTPDSFSDGGQHFSVDAAVEHALALVEHKGDLAACNVVGLATPPWFVPDTTTLEEQMEGFREQRTHFALVVDEYGALQGLVTLEDILAEIIGELPDEHQVEERPDVRRRPDGSYLIEGWMPADEFAGVLAIPLPLSRPYNTAAGFMLQLFGEIPAVGDTRDAHGWRFEIVDLDGRRIDKILATKIAQPRRAM